MLLNSYSSLSGQYRDHDPSIFLEVLKQILVQLLSFRTSPVRDETYICSQLYWITLPYVVLIRAPVSLIPPHLKKVFAEKPSGRLLSITADFVRANATTCKENVFGGVQRSVGRLLVLLAELRSFNRESIQGHGLTIAEPCLSDCGGEGGGGPIKQVLGLLFLHYTTLLCIATHNIHLM